MGERQGWLFEPTFNRSIKLRYADPRISDNAGTLLLREVDHRLGLSPDLVAEFTDLRNPARSRAAGVLWGRLLERIKRWWRDEAWGRPQPPTRTWVPPPRHAHLHLVFRE